MNVGPARTSGREEGAANDGPPSGGDGLRRERYPTTACGADR